MYDLSTLWNSKNATSQLRPEKGIRNSLRRDRISMVFPFSYNGFDRRVQVIDLVMALDGA
jgi:hypothetical protein